jgi:SAM-dependent methyltransferase
MLTPLLEAMRYPDREFRRRLRRYRDLRAAQKRLGTTVSLRVHPRDDMYDDADHYLRIGLSAIRCIEAAITKEPASILDFPCGYGRVLRFLRVRFPHAHIHAGEIERDAVVFVRRTFGVPTIISDIDLRAVSLPTKFDLIWSGSLLTHLSEERSTNALTFYYRHLAPGGTLVFSMHGRETERRFAQWNDPSAAKILSELSATGYGYANYSNSTTYGNAIVTKPKMLALAAAIGDWQLTHFAESAWDANHDIYAFRRAA